MKRQNFTRRIAGKQEHPCGMKIENRTWNHNTKFRLARPYALGYIASAFF